MKHTFYREWVYVLALIAMALGVAVTEAADFGVSMVVAPAYLLHLKLSPFFDFFTFGFAEYVFQGLLLVVMALLLRRFRVSYLFSFVTALLYGLVLDGFIQVMDCIPADMLWVRAILFVAGCLISSIGVSLFFHTYFPPLVYEMLVKEVSARFHIDIHRFKTVYDCSSLALSVVLSFFFFGFGHFEGIKLGTLICALFNGWLIGRCSQVLEKHFTFVDRLPLARFFS